MAASKKKRPREAAVTRARGQTDAGVARCIELMSNVSWQTGKSAAMVAEEFGVTLRTAEGWSAQASRIVRMSLNDKEELRARVVLAFERHERVAMSRIGRTMAGDEYANPDVKAATNAMKAFAEVMGLITQKHEVAVVVAQYEQLPREQKAKWLRDRADALIAEAKRLEA